MVPIPNDTNDDGPISYKVKKNDATGMKERFFDGELLTMFLNPSQSKMNFGDLVTFNGDAITRLKSIRPFSNKIQSKINYIQELNELIDNYCTAKKPLEKAQNLFTEYVVSLFPKHRRVLRLLCGGVYEDKDTKKAVTDFNAEFEKKEKADKICFSECMTTREAIEFWLDPNSVSTGEDDSDLGWLIRYGAINFLLYSKNQSPTERVFGFLRRSATSCRNNLKHETALAELIVREFRKNASVFDRLASTEKTKKTAAETAADKELRKV